MKIFKRQSTLDFDQPNWDLDPELFVIHQILESHEHLVLLAKPCFPNAKDETQGVVGRDGMTLEQVVRSTIYQRHKRMSYEELSRATGDSKIGRTFMKMGLKAHLSPQALQENIARISVDALENIQLAICSYAIKLGVDTGKKVRPDSTVIKTNIHHPTNASLLWDCIRVACDLLKASKALLAEIRFRNYQKGSKKLFVKIVNITGKNAREKRTPLFKKLLKYLKCCENQVIEAIDVLNSSVPHVRDKAEEKRRQKLLQKFKELLPMMQQIGDVAYRREILDEKVPVAEKIFSIFESHTDCICKGSRQSLFGHKINFTAGDSHLIFDCIMERGNPADTKLYPKTIDNLGEKLGIVPDSIASDGGFASTDNKDYALSKNIKNVVFNKVRGSLQNVASSKKMETMLKKWRAGIEAVISNFKRGLNARTCTWKGWDAFQKFVLWNVITFNLRIIARFVIKQMA